MDKPHPHTDKDKKHDKKHDDKHDKHKPHDEQKDLRRAFEHLGRVSAISNQVSHTKSKFSALFEQTFQQGKDALNAAGKDHSDPQQKKNAADLLRASEHLAFAALQDGAKPGPPATKPLTEAIHKEFHKLQDKARDNADSPENPTFDKLREQISKEAQHALDGEHFQCAMELARAAEALSHLQPDERDAAAA